MDSRTVGMCSYVSLSSSEDCSIAKGGEGYPWLTGSSVSSSLDSLIGGYPNSYIVINIDTNSVSDFNKVLKKNLSSLVKYCDVYSSIANSYRTIDGVHYDENTYKSIYNAIKKCLD